MMRSANTMFGALLLLTSITAAPQDLVAVAPQAAKVEYENARVRVVRLRIAPHETLPMHDRPSRVVIPLTPNDVTTTRADGRSSEVKAEAAKPAWSEPGKRSVTNHDSALENIVLELKQSVPPAKALAEPPNPRPAGYLEDRFHRWLFENQYVRVFEEIIPPGAITDWHEHSLDSVSVFLTGGTTSEQLEGQEWDKPGTNPAGLVAFVEFAHHPMKHRLRNDGRQEFRLVLVQFLQ